jgi:beta-lactamase regulating signal transducer with metallopeptidase domain/DUF4097 and DUF4098 domain-containing protein YvlB
MGGPTAVVIKATLILASAAFAVVLLRRASAAFRHLIWLLGLTACAALAVFSPAAPSIDVDIPTRTLGEPSRSIFQPRIGVGELGRGAAATIIDASSGESFPVTVNIASASLEAPSRAHGSLTLLSYIPLALLAVWAIGCVFILARCVIGHRRVRRLIDAADPLVSPEWSAALQAASIDLRFTGDVDLLVSDALSAPITSGFLRPVIILPAECASWDTERQRIVLVHELAHVARLDYVAQLVGTIACAIFWFHPAVWFAAAQLRAEAEHAADDRVIAAGTLGLTYATHLLELARGDRTPVLSPAASVGMIRSSRLEGRFRAMLDSTRSRAAVTPRFQATAATLMLCAMIPAAGVRTVARATPIERAEEMEPMEAVAVPVERLVTTAVPSKALSVLATNIQAVSDSTFEKTIEASSGGKLTLDLRTGAEVILHGWDEPRVRLVARLAGRNWQDTRVDLSQTSAGVRLRSDFATHRDNQSTSHRFELWVPRHMDVSMSSAGGSVSISDLAGEFSGHTGGGEITIERARGYASLTTGGGSVTVTNSDLSGRVSTGGGNVEISNVTGGLRGSSGSGNVIINGDGLATTTIRGNGRRAEASVENGRSITVTQGTTTILGEPKGFGGRTTNITGQRGTTVTTSYPDRTDAGVGFGYGGYSISKAGGQIVLDDLPSGGNLHTGGGRIFVRSSGGSISASTGGGDIELNRVAGNARATTGSGDVQITIVNANGTEHSVEVESGRGTVELYLPANIDARFELETAYTDNFDRRTKIESDFTLDRSETRDWDDRFGTPRKFVRAQGAFGNGAGLIRVRTVNGDVIVRRR